MNRVSARRRVRFRVRVSKSNMKIGAVPKSENCS